MYEVIASGKDVETAVANGCSELGVSRDQVTYEIIDFPQKRLFGSKPARVLVKRKEEEFSVADLLGGFGSVKESAPEKKQETPKKEKKQDKPAAKPQKAEKTAAVPTETKADKAPKTEKVEKTELAEKTDAPKAEKKSNKKNKKKSAQKSENTAVSTEEPEVLEPVEFDALPDSAKRALDYLKQIAEQLGAKDIEYSFGKTERGIRIILSGGDASTLIGRRGETMDAIQYLCSVVASSEEKDYARITLDIEGYRSRRERALQELAAKMAAKAKRTHSNQVLEPMNPYERRIVHAAVQKIEGVTSHSVGSEPHRKVVIAVEGGGRSNRSRSSSRKGGEHREQKSAPTPKPQMKDIPVRKELKSTEEFMGTLYGKIEL